MVTVFSAGLAISSLGCDPEGATQTPEAEAELPLQDAPDAPQSLTLSSREFEDGAALQRKHEFAGFGCTGDNVAPPLSWDDGPPETESYALVVHDPDAPTGVGFFHWVVVDIPADVTQLDGADLPSGARALYTDYAQTGFGGPCPPPGAPHRYVFSVYALDVEQLEVPDGATGALTRFVLANHTLAYGRLVGTYQR